MDTNDIYDRWYKKVRAEGQAEGKAEGKAEDEARALLAILSARGLPVSESQAAKIRACQDPDQLELWVRRAVAAASTDDVLV